MSYLILVVIIGVFLYPERGRCHFYKHAFSQSQHAICGTCLGLDCLFSVIIAINCFCLSAELRCDINFFEELWYLFGYLLVITHRFLLIKEW